MSGIKLTRKEQKKLFGEGFSEDYADEAEQRWGATEAWRRSKQRTSKYTKADWAEVKAEMDANLAEFVSAMSDGEPATSERAMDAAEAHR
jgi:kynureninase